MQLSYWEYKHWIQDIDHLIIGSGIVGLTCALRLREKFPKDKTIILERGALPSGASTKNAGFACFGSISELAADAIHIPEDEILETVAMRWQGLQLLRNTVGDSALDYKNHGGIEVFRNGDSKNYLDQVDYWNKVLKGVVGDSAFAKAENKYSFSNLDNSVIVNKLEGQIDTGMMIKSLLKLAGNKNIDILNGVEVDSVHEGCVNVGDLEIKAPKIYIAVNGFASRLLDLKVTPARNQVLVTSPIENLDWKGTFHLDEGYFYFRNIGNQVLIGGGRHLDAVREETDAMEFNNSLQHELEKLLKEHILPGKIYKINHRWTGILGVGKSKKPIIQKLSAGTACGVRLGGMGVAIGSLVGKQLAEVFD